MSARRDLDTYEMSDETGIETVNPKTKRIIDIFHQIVTNTLDERPNVSTFQKA